MLLNVCFNNIIIGKLYVWILWVGKMNSIIGNLVTVNMAKYNNFHSKIGLFHKNELSIECSFFKIKKLPTSNFEYRKFCNIFYLNLRSWDLESDSLPNKKKFVTCTFEIKLSLRGNQSLTLWVQHLVY